MARSPLNLPLFEEVEGEYQVRAYRSRVPPLYLSFLSSSSHRCRAKPGCCSPLPPPTLLSTTSSQPPPRALPLPALLGPHTSYGGPQPMDMDGTRGYKGALTMEERRRRSDAGLCAYCGTASHTLATCALASRAR